MTLETGNRRTGFSLLEMMITLVILSVLVTFASVSLDGFQREEELGRAAFEIKRMAQRTLRTSLTKGKVNVMRLDPSVIVSGKELFELPAGMELRIRPWGATRWIRPDGYQWVFEPTGLCEPIGMRLTLAGAWQEVAFHPLTAEAEEEYSWIP